MRPTKKNKKAAVIMTIEAKMLVKCSNLGYGTIEIVIEDFALDEW